MVSKMDADRLWKIAFWPLGFFAFFSILLNVHQYTNSPHRCEGEEPLDAPYGDVHGDADEGLFDLDSHMLASSRMLGSSVGSNVSTSNIGSSAQGSGGGHHGPHKHDALLFLFNAVVIGIVISHLKFLKMFHAVQETVALFVIGVVYSLVQHGLKLEEKIGVFGESYMMWMKIDPHLLLFTLLPALLTGDAMTIDTSVVKRVAMQCVYLAGPGVLVNACLVAVFLKYYLSWDFLLSLVTGAILCATDPVAVVALLKELGASPVLTIQIQGESLLNDGTAIVLYSVAYRMLQGETFDFSDIIMFVITVALMAWALGMVIGFVFFVWIRAADNRLQHASEIIQISLTLACGYWSFIIAEGVFHISGVLACVAAALTLAHFMWPHVVAPESMHHVWHMLETLGNTIIFFLAGALTGKTMVEIEAIDYLHLIVIYIVLTCVRGGLIFASRPILRLLNADKAKVTMAEAAVMTWGGLRGAVGLALAIQVYNDKAPDTDGNPKIGDKDARRVLFFVGGIAFMTTVVNAPTCPALVTWLGITAPSEAKVSFIKLIHQRLVSHTKADAHPSGVKYSLNRVLNHTVEHITHGHSQHNGSEMKKPVSEEPWVLDLSEFEHGRDWYQNIPESQQELLGYDDETNLTLAKMITEAAAREEQLLGRIRNANVETRDLDMCRVFNDAFLSLVRASYWRQIHKRVLPPGSQMAETLLHSVQMSLSYPRPDLYDFTYVFDYLCETKQGNRPSIHKDDAVVKGFKSLTKQLDEKTESNPKWAVFLTGSPAAMRVANSTPFSLGMALVIVLNGIYIAIEEKARDKSEDDSPAWLFFEVLFTSVFVLEFGTKLAATRLRYFLSAWNVFDFVLVVFGVFGCVVDLISNDFDKQTATGGQARIIRMSRVFKVARLLRLFRLFNMFWIVFAKLDKHTLSIENGEHLKKFTALTAYVKAHLHAQRDFMHLLCPGFRLVSKKGRDPTKENGEVMQTEENQLSVDVCSCMLSSQGAVYKAAALAIRAVNEVSKETLDQISQVRESQDLVEELEELVFDARSKGVLSGSDAESLTHPLHDHIHHCQKLISKTIQGFEMGLELQQELSMGPHDHHAAVPVPNGHAPTAKVTPMPTEAEPVFNGVHPES